MAVSAPPPPKTVKTSTSTKTKKEIDAKRLLKARRLKANQRLRAKSKSTGDTPEGTSLSATEYQNHVAQSSGLPLGSFAKVPHVTPSTKPKTKLTADALAWKSLDESIQQSGGISTLDEGGGMMMFEEVEGIDVEWEEDDKGRKRAVLVEGGGVMDKAAGKDAVGKGKKRKRDAKAGATMKVEDGDEGEQVSESIEDHVDPDEGRSETGSTPAAEQEAKPSDAAQIPPTAPDHPFDPILLPSWTSPEAFSPPLPCALHSIILHGLHSMRFENPTEIQKRSVGVALAHLAERVKTEGDPESSVETPPKDGGKRDIVGVSETGSGKTLAYSIPILHHLLTAPSSRTRGKRQLSALILCPTRELALQVGRHISELVSAGEAASAVATELAKGKSKGKNKKSSSSAGPVPYAKLNLPTGPPRVSIATVVGGLSALKQKRLLARGCDILIATPGRLWELCEEDQALSIQIKRVRFLVIDEADRMIENGHFAELEHIVQLTARPTNSEPVATNAAEDDPIFAVTTREIDRTRARTDMQTFVFSATLSKDLQSNLKRGIRRRGKSNQGSTLDDLVERLDFRDQKPEIINLSREGGVVATLRESLIECIVSEKDFYLYYFLLRYPGRTLVFVGSIDGIRRLVPLFEILKVPVFPLHSQLQQKQRLKNLDRFASSKSGVLIATDVAARGLDIPSVDHVIHFQLPRTADAYIHRSGRTARAKRDGFSLIMCSPEERGALRALMKGLGRTPDLPELPIEPGFLTPMKNRIRIAKDIEKAQHHSKREKSEKGWLVQAAETLGVDIDKDLISDEEDQEDAPEAKRRKNLTHKYSQGNVQNLRAELDSLLRQQLMARGVSARYPTSGSRAIMDDLLNDSTGHVELLGASTKKAHEDVDAKPKGKKFLTFGKKRK